MVRISLMAACVFAIWACAGCQAPVVTLEYVLPGPLPHAHRWRVEHVEAFDVDAPPTAGTGLSEHLRQELLARLAPCGLHDGPPAGAAVADEQPAAGEAVRRVDAEPLPVVIGGAIHVTVNDSAGLRVVSAAGGIEELPSLRRQADARVEFAVTPLDGDGGGEGEAMVVEIVRSYDSLSDPSAWGPLGLSRHDGPDAIAPADQVVASLLSQCAAAMAQLVPPVTERAVVTMRTAGGPAGRRGVSAMRGGRFAEARQALREASNDRPGDGDALFNAAVAAEADAEAEEALDLYRQAWQAGLRDAQTQAAISRLEAVLRRPQVLELRRSVQ